jgi:hypothetical protein
VLHPWPSLGFFFRHEELGCRFCLRVCFALPWLLSDSDIVGAERIRMYFITVLSNAPQISFTAATDNQLDPSRSISLLSMTLTINGAERWNSRRNTYIHLVDPIPLSQWHPAQNQTRLHLKLCAYGQRT